MKRILCLIALLLPLTIHAQDEQPSDLWQPFEFLVGRWEGTSEGRWGSATITTEYEIILDGSFLYGIATSTYPPQEKNPEGESHVNWDIFSYDKSRRKYVLRQFHNEHIVNRYTVDSLDVVDGAFEMVTEAIENFRSGWRAKEAFEVVNESAYIERFYLAPPGEDFQLYVTNHFKRKE